MSLYRLAKKYFPSARANISAKAVGTRPPNYVEFELPGGERVWLHTTQSASIQEGDEGTLTIAGLRFLSFERK